MRKSSNLIQKSYYLDRELDKELIEFLSSIRNRSDFVRQALYNEMELYKQNNNQYNYNIRKTNSNNNTNPKQKTEENQIASDEDVTDFINSFNSGLRNT